jgi:hypothetical protein
VKHPPIEIPQEVIEAERELLRAERDAGRGAPGAGLRLNEAQRRAWRAWEPFQEQLRRHARELALPLDDEP